MCLLDRPLTIILFLQKTAVAVAYVKAGSGLLKLNGEQKQQQSLSVLQQSMYPWKLAQSSIAIRGCSMLYDASEPGESP
jgi:hypothetical protein